MPGRTNEAAHSGDLIAGNVAQLKALFPQIITDGKIDFEVLRQLLGEAVEEGEERYGLNWKGKAAARAFALTPSLGTLRPAPEDSVDWDSTQNILIEGDNLEVLKLLRRSYAGKVKLIYIDPPYNTGNDFVYPDDYRDSIGNYEALTGQRGADGARMTSNKEASGRFHTDWLNMMYPRLVLAKELLRDDGAIFISIGDEELSNISTLCGEIFGEENWLATIAWQKKYGVSADAKGIPLMQDYIVSVQRSPSFKPGLLPRTEKQESLYSNPDNDPRGVWTSGDLLRNELRERDRYEIVAPTGRRHLPPSNASWRHPEAQIEQMMADNRVWFGPDGNGVPRVKRFLSETKDGVVISGWWPHTEAGHTDEARKETKRLMEEDVFQTPKPIRLLTRIAQTANATADDLILDFFAGSGTTGHAVMAQNASDGGRRRHILVQLPEPLDPANSSQKTAADFCDTLGKPRTIAELTKERLRRAGAKLKADHPGKDFDTGFRVYKLATSNLRPWQPHAENLAASLLDGVDNILPGRSEDDLLTELLLKTGIDLTLPTQSRDIAGHRAHALGGGALIVCLSAIADDAAEALAHGIADWRAELAPAAQTAFWFKDSGFASAAAKANVAAILKQRIAATDIARIAAL
ncbi:MAG: site-specific DNA-methyltransferase [Sphingomonas sp.]|nr:MAG: site-specific DNA-methyltransferase [Sphingomonas sp.]